MKLTTKSLTNTSESSCSRGSVEDDSDPVTPSVAFSKKSVDTIEINKSCTENQTFEYGSVDSPVPTTIHQIMRKKLNFLPNQYQKSNCNSSEKVARSQEGQKQDAECSEIRNVIGEGRELRKGIEKLKTVRKWFLREKMTTTCNEENDEVFRRIEEQNTDEVVYEAHNSHANDEIMKAGHHITVHQALMNRAFLQNSYSRGASGNELSLVSKT
jgi:hypothetical protein